ncbi:MAG: hypothetical protein WCX27_00805 [Candidatus Paceibacterota bacterium]|jgi:hypothetical protein
MSKGMLGMLSLSEVRGPKADLDEKLASENGKFYLEMLKDILRLNPPVQVGSVATGFPLAKTNIKEALREAENFHKKAFGGLFKKGVSLEKLFVLPETLPWQNVIAIFVPKGADYGADIKAMAKARKGLNVYEEEKVNSYSNSQAEGRHRLYIIERSERPTKETMNMSPDQLVETGKQFLGLGAYAIAMGNYHEATGSYLDSGETVTWFPKDCLSDGRVASGYWHPGSVGVRFSWNHSGDSHPDWGARLAIEVSLKP